MGQTVVVIHVREATLAHLTGSDGTLQLVTLGLRLNLKIHPTGIE